MMTQAVHVLWWWWWWCMMYDVDILHLCIRISLCLIVIVVYVSVHNLKIVLPRRNLTNLYVWSYQSHDSHRIPPRDDVNPRWREMGSNINITDDTSHWNTSHWNTWHMTLDTWHVDDEHVMARENARKRPSKLHTHIHIHVNKRTIERNNRNANVAKKCSFTVKLERFISRQKGMNGAMAPWMNMKIMSCAINTHHMTWHDMSLKTYPNMCKTHIHHLCYVRSASAVYVLTWCQIHFTF